MEMEKIYVAPVVEVMEIEVEKGFGNSYAGDGGVNPGIDTPDLD